ncbi:MAG: hypothetical protein PHS25_12160, partial [Proteiniphilum sp.]|nr:hypothetical protein [Proteiniphilum sp.]MDD3075017.1 hypothetical protein [Proteiniphilum sp.]
GLKPDELESGIFHDLMNRCSLKTYIPIISFPTDLKFTRERNERWFIWILCDALGKCTFFKI